MVRYSPVFAGIEGNAVALLLVGYPVVPQRDGQPALVPNEFLQVLGRQVPAPTRLIAGDAAVGQRADHAVVVLPAVRVQAAAHAADLHHPGAAEPLHDVDIMDAAVHDSGQSAISRLYRGQSMA